MSPNKNNSNPSKNNGTVNRYAVVGMSVSSTREDGWIGFNNALIAAVVKTITAAGDAVLFSTTRQGGISITIYSDGSPVKIFSNDQLDMAEKLGEVIRLARQSIPAQVLERMDTTEG